MLIPRVALIASEDFSATLPAASVAEAIARGLLAGGLLEADLLPLTREELAGGELRTLLDALGFDERMRAARAVIVAAPRLHERTLDGSVAFEIATRARQGGVPAYAVTAENELDAFDARILDLQLVIEAGTSRTLVAAGRKLAEAVLCAV